MHISDHHYGVGVFEGVRSYATDGGAAVFRLQDHTARLLRSAHIMKIPLPSGYDRDFLADAQLKLLRKNGLRDAYVRPFVFYAGAMGLRPSTQDLSVRVAIMALEWRDHGASDGGTKQRGIALQSSSFTRPSAASQFIKAKTNGNYLHGILALQEAQASGADDVLLLDQHGFVTETSGANLFVVQGGVIYTPPLASVLEGVTRATIIVLASSLGISVVEQQLTRDDVYVADEAFLTGTASEVTPIRQLDGRKVGPGSRGPITEQLQSLYLAHVRGRGEHHPEWLTHV